MSRFFIERDSRCFFSSARLAACKLQAPSAEAGKQRTARKMEKASSKKFQRKLFWAVLPKMLHAFRVIYDCLAVRILKKLKI